MIFYSSAGSQPARWGNGSWRRRRTWARKLRKKSRLTIRRRNLKRETRSRRRRKKKKRKRPLLKSPKRSQLQLKRRKLFWSTLALRLLKKQSLVKRACLKQLKSIHKASLKLIRLLLKHRPTRNTMRSFNRSTRRLWKKPNFLLSFKFQSLIFSKIQLKRRREPYFWF